MRIAICGVPMAESLLTGLVFTFHRVLVGRNFASGICKLKPKKKQLKTYLFCLKYLCFPAVCDCV